MQKLIFTLLAVFMLSTIGFASFSSSPVAETAQTEAVGNIVTSNNIEARVAQMKFFISLTAEKYGELRGKKLNALERFYFHASQKRMKKMLKLYDSGDEPNTLQKINWLLKGYYSGRSR